MKTQLLTIGCLTLALTAYGQITVDLVDGDGLTNTTVSGDSLVWSTTVNGDALDITVSPTDADFSAWDANTSRDGFGMETTRGGNWSNAFDGDPDNGGIAESFTLAFSSPVDLGASGLLFASNKLGEDLADEATADATAVYRFSINGGAFTDGTLTGWDPTRGYDVEFTIGENLTSVSNLTVSAVDGIQGGFRAKTLEIAAVVPEPSLYAALLGALSLGLVFWRKRR